MKLMATKPTRTTTTRALKVGGAFVLLLVLADLIIALVATVLLIVLWTGVALYLTVIHTTVPREIANDNAIRFLSRPLPHPDSVPGGPLDTSWVWDESMDDILTEYGRKQYKRLRSWLANGTWPDPKQRQGADLNAIPVTVPRIKFTWQDYELELEKLLSGKFPYIGCIPDDKVDPNVKRANTRALKARSATTQKAIARSIARKKPRY